MKVAVPSTGPTLDHYVAAKFSRSAYLLIIDPGTMRYDTMRNPLAGLTGPAATILFTRLLSQHNVKTIVAGGCDSSIFRTLTNTGVRILAGTTGSVRRAVERYKSLDLLRAS